MVRRVKLKGILQQIITSHDFSDRGAANTDSRWAGISECLRTLTFQHTNLGNIICNGSATLHIPPFPHSLQYDG